MTSIPHAKIWQCLVCSNRIGECEYIRKFDNVWCVQIESDNVNKLVVTSSTHGISSKNFVPVW